MNIHAVLRSQGVSISQFALYVEGHVTSHGLLGIAQLIWLWCAHALCRIWDGCQWYWSIIYCIVTVSLLANGCYKSSFSLVGDFTCLQGCGEYGSEVGSELEPGPLALFVLSPFSSLVTSAWLMLRFSMTGWGMTQTVCPPLLCWRWRHTVGLEWLPCPWHLVWEYCCCAGVPRQLISSFGLYILPELLCNYLFVFASLFILILIY